MYMYRFFPLSESCFMPLHFYKRLTLVWVFANGNESEEDLCFYKVVIASLVYPISAYQRCHQMAVLLSQLGKPV